MIYLQAFGVLSTLGGALAVLLLIADRFLADYGPCSITINDRDPFIIEGGVKLLEALYEQKIFIPSACGGQGTCGFCKVNVLEGGGPVLPTELPYLCKAEIAANTRLACLVKVKQNLRIHVKDEYLNVQEFRTTVTAAGMLTPDTREILLKLTDPVEIEFVPAQYVQVMVPGMAEPTYRAYSISSPPSAKNEVELLVRLVPGGLCSTYLHNVQVDDEVIFTGPYGEFVDDEEAVLICVGGGCGIAPMRSLLRHACEVTPERECLLFFGVRTAEDVMYMKEFKELKSRMPNLHVHYALSEPQHSPDWQGETGFIHESVEKHVSSEGKRIAFMCGPPLMIEATMKELAAKGIPRENVFYDEF